MYRLYTSRPGPVSTHVNTELDSVVTGLSTLYRGFPRCYPDVTSGLHRYKPVFYVGFARPLLPDKEFRYHRTIIVIAAVHRSLKNQLLSYESDQPFLTYRHWAGVSPYTLPFGFAETCVLVKQSRSVIY